MFSWLCKKQKCRLQSVDGLNSAPPTLCVGYVCNGGIITKLPIGQRQHESSPHPRKNRARPIKFGDCHPAAGLMDVLEMDSDTRGFLLSSLGGLAGILGSCILFADIPIRQIPRFQKFDMKESRVFMVIALSLSAGVMILAALWKVLAEASGYLKLGDAILTLCFLAGVLLCGLINIFMHKLTPLSIVQCAHDQEDGPDTQEGDPQINDVQGGDDQNVAAEEQPLLSEANKRKRSSRLRSCKNPENDCMGYSRPCSHCYRKATADNGFSSGSHGQEGMDDSSPHHHHYEQERSRCKFFFFPAG